MRRGSLGRGLKNNPIRVLAEIIMSEKKGITQEELSSRLSIDRTTVYRITQKWEREGKIKKNSDGRYTRYTANTNAIQDVAVSSYFQAHWAAFHALKSRRIERISYFADREKLETADPMTTAVFLFSVKAGALLTYMLKEALNPKSQFLSVMIDSEKDSLSDDQKYELTLAWLRNYIITSLPTVLYRFRESIFKVIATKEPLQDHNVTFDRWAQLMSKEPRHALSDNVYGMIDEAFRESFASISRDLDGTTRRLHS
jgi:Fe2+ or Zn2+ uptake regulation protein